MSNRVALGQAPLKGVGLAVPKSNLSDKERLAILEQQIVHMQNTIRRLKGTTDRPIADVTEGLNKDGIPIALECYGSTESNPFLMFLTVEEDGYRIGTHKFASLSAAAQAVSGVRRSGWTFWKLPDGTTLKEAFKDV